jgi:hypothetical protein
MVTPIKSGKGMAPAPSTEVRSPSECHATLNRAQCLKLVSNSDIEISGRCSGAIKVIPFIENQKIEDKILNHLRDKNPNSSTLPLLIPTSRAHPQRTCLPSRGSARESRFQSDHNQPLKKSVKALWYALLRAITDGFNGYEWHAQ